MTDYLAPSAERDRMYAQERLIFDATEAVCEALEIRERTRADLARALDVRPSEITQRLNGTRNLTLHSVADMLFALNFRLRIELDDLDRDARWSHSAGAQVTKQTKAPLARYTRSGNVALVDFAAAAA